MALIKELSVVLLAIASGLVMDAEALAEKTDVRNVIPERFAFVEITDVESDATIDKDYILKQIRAAMEEQLKVKTLQYIIYTEDQTPGEGVFRAFGELTSIPEKEVVEFEEYDVKNYENNKERMAFVEKIIGNYEITPKELWEIYSDNEVVADDDFKGKGILMEIKVPGVSKDFNDQPYISVPADRHGFSGIRLQLSKDDPLVRSIKKGSEIIIKGLPQGMSMKDVIVRAEIVKIMK
jgi:hypothetical protein